MWAWISGAGRSLRRKEDAAQVRADVGAARFGSGGARDEDLVKGQIGCCTLLPPGDDESLENRDGDALLQDGGHGQVLLHVFEGRR